MPPPIPAAPMPIGSSARKRRHEAAPELSSEAWMLCSQAHTAALWLGIFLGHFSSPLFQMVQMLSGRTGSPTPPVEAAWIRDATGWLLPVPSPWVPGGVEGPQPQC